MKKTLMQSAALAALSLVAGSTAAQSPSDTRHAIDLFGVDTKKAKGICGIEGISQDAGAKGNKLNKKADGAQQQQAAIADKSDINVTITADVGILAAAEIQQVGSERQVGE